MSGDVPPFSRYMLSLRDQGAILLTFAVYVFRVMYVSFAFALGFSVKVEGCYTIENNDIQQMHLNTFIRYTNSPTCFGPSGPSSGSYAL